MSVKCARCRSASLHEGECPHCGFILRSTMFEDYYNDKIPVEVEE